MRPLDPYVGSGMVASLVRALGHRAHGLGLEQLAGVGSLEALTDPAVRLPNGMDDALFARAAEGLGRPWLGLWFGVEAADERAFGALGYLARHAPTLADSLARVVRYGRLFTSGEPTEVSAGLGAFWIVEGKLTAKHWSPVMGDAILATWLTLLQRWTQSAVAPVAAHFASPRPADDTRHRALFGEALCFDAPAYALQFPSDILERPLVDVDLVLGATLEQQAQELLGLGAEESAVVRRIHALLEAGEWDLSGVAQALAMHPRTLQRRLAELGLDWRTLRDRYRQDVAERLLATSGVSLKKVAARAGFADVTSFRRAFRRWTGQGPRAQRDGQAWGTLAQEGRPVPPRAGPASPERSEEYIHRLPSTVGHAEREVNGPQACVDRHEHAARLAQITRVQSRARRRDAAELERETGPHQAAETDGHLSDRKSHDEPSEQS